MEIAPLKGHSSFSRSPSTSRHSAYKGGEDTSTLASSKFSTSGASRHSHSRSVFSGQTSRGSESDFAFRDRVLDDGAFEIHPQLLTFRDSAIERLYCDFMYTNGGFYGGKMWHLLAITVLLAFVFLYSRKGLFFTGGGAVFLDPPAVMMWVSSLVSVFVLGSLFVGPLRRHRESLFILSLMTHWPAFAIFGLHGKDPVKNTYGTPLICFFFCSLVTFARFSRVIFFLSVTPLIVFFSVTFGVDGYWDHRSHYEMVYWFTMVPIILLLHSMERRLRLCFAEVELARSALTSVDEKSEMAQGMLVSFFPPTITRDLLAVKRPPSFVEYHHTLLIQTDIKGFTAWSSERGPNEVVDMLTVMIQVMEDYASRDGVEKITTIGDAFVGASFARNAAKDTLLLQEGSVDPKKEQPTEPRAPGAVDGEDEMEEQMSTTQDKELVSVLEARCSAVLHFACAVLHSAPQLELRVGVCMGTVTAGIVGSQPPKVDIFGTAVATVALMEQTSRSGFAHIAEDVYRHAENRGSTRGTVEIGTHGTLIQRWADESNGNGDSTGRAMRTALKERSRIITRNLDLVAAERESSVPPSARSRHSNRSNGTASVAGGILIEDISSDNTGGMFHPLFLRFYEEKIETQFSNFIYESGTVQRSQQLLLVLMGMLSLAAIGTVCVDSPGNRALMICIVADVILFAAYLAFIGTTNRFNYPIVWIIYAIPVVMCSMLTATCDGYIGPAGYYQSVAWSCSYALWSVGPVFCVDVPMVIRLSVATATTLFGLVMVPIHRAVVGRDDVYLDAGLVIACTAVSGCVSFFVDYTLRSAFAASIHMRLQMEAAHEKQAAIERRAIDLMLPPFVTTKLMAITKAAGASRGRRGSNRHAASTVDDASILRESVSGEFMGDDEDGDADQSLLVSIRGMNRAGDHPTQNKASAVWDYPRSICIFMEFSRFSDDGAEDPNIMNTRDSVIRVAEEAFALGELQKVKTIQNTILAVAGIEEGTNPQASALRALHTVLDLMRAMRSDGIQFRVGIHTGPCFGAVIGTTGLTFDVFGDTVNTASRLQTNAAPDSVLASRSLVTLLGRHATRFDVSSLEAIAMKGKGVMEVFGIAQRTTTAAPVSLVGHEAK